MIPKGKDLQTYYIAVLMPNSGRGANHVRYYKASNDLKRLFYIEQDINPKGWKQAFLESLIVVPKKKYHYPLDLDDDVIMASVAKVIGVTSSRPKFVIGVSKAQFVLAKDWTAKTIPPNYLAFIKHDYNTATKEKLQQDWDFWRHAENRNFIPIDSKNNLSLRHVLINLQTLV